ncbi:MAG: hypothetical protein AAF320_01020 [Myxococcota bacterium]
MKTHLILLCSLAVLTGGCNNESPDDNTNKSENEKIQGSVDKPGLETQPKEPSAKTLASNKKKTSTSAANPAPTTGKPVPPSAKKKCVASPAKAAAYATYCTDQLAKPAAVGDPQGTCEEVVGTKPACDYTAGPPNETCTRTNFAAEWPGFGVIANDNEFCTYLGTDAMGNTSNINCDSVYLTEFTNIANQETICARNPGGIGCLALGDANGDLPNAWDDDNYCTQITAPANRGLHTFQAACEAATIAIENNPLGPPHPTNNNKAGLRFCTYQPAHTCKPQGDVCTGQSKAVCTGALNAICDWK